MIGWVDAVLKEWGRAQHWLMFGKHGVPSRTILGKLIEEGPVGASTNQFTREFPEVLCGENLIVANAVKTLPEHHRAIVSVHYVIRLPAYKKYKRIGISKHAYYDYISDAQVKVANAIEAQDLKRKVLERPLTNIIGHCNPC